MKIDFSANLTAQFYTSQSTIDLCNSAEYATAMAQAALNDGLDPVAYASNYGLNLNASQGIGIQAYDLSVSNATDKYSALFSLGYKKNNGILKYTDFENFSGRVNTSFNVNKLVTVCENLTISYTNQVNSYPMEKADETYHKVLLTRVKPTDNGSKKGYLWAVSAPKLGLVFFVYEDGSRSEQVILDL